LPVFPRRLRTLDLNPMMAPPRELDIKRMVGARESGSSLVQIHEDLPIQ
jgi:hypothetical protein